MLCQDDIVHLPHKKDVSQFKLKNETLLLILHEADMCF